MTVFMIFYMTLISKFETIIFLIFFLRLYNRFLTFIQLIIKNWSKLDFFYIIFYNLKKNGWTHYYKAYTNRTSNSLPIILLIIPNIIMVMKSSIKATFLYAISHFNHENSLNAYFHIYVVAITCYSATYDPYQERKWTKLI